MAQLCEIECTVVSGLEIVAKDEVEKKLGLEVFETMRGRINFKIPFDRLKEVSKLRGVDNFHCVLKRFTDVQFSTDEAGCFKILKGMVEEVDWDFGLEVWKEFFAERITDNKSDKALTSDLNTNIKNNNNTELEYNNTKDNSNNNVSINSDQSIEAGDNITSTNVKTDKATVSESATTKLPSATKTSTDLPTSTAQASAAETNITPTNHQAQLSHQSPQTSTPHSFIPRYRVTCKRVGTHSFQSPQAAHHFGGAINDLWGWIVDLSDFQVEVMLLIGEREVRVGVALTQESLHRRNISHFGPTTLKPTIAHGMLWHARIQPGDIVCDPMCGTSSIAIECLDSQQPPCYSISADVSKKILKKSLLNWQEYLGRKKGEGEEKEAGSALDLLKWDVTRLPLKDECVDVIITDLPFGKRIGSKVDNWQLYKGMLNECARVVRRQTGRVCLLTHDRKCIIRSMELASRYFKRGTTVGINIGGLAAGIYVLHRNTRAFVCGDGNDADMDERKSGRRKNKDRFGGDFNGRVTTNEGGLPNNGE